MDQVHESIASSESLPDSSISRFAQNGLHVCMHDFSRLLSCCRVADRRSDCVPGARTRSATSQAPGNQVSEVITLREGWLVSAGGGGRGRVSLPTDRLEWAWLEGKLSLPDKSKDESPSAADLPPWKRVQADDQGAFTGSRCGRCMAGHVRRVARGTSLAARCTRARFRARERCPALRRYLFQRSGRTSRAAPVRNQHAGIHGLAWENLGPVAASREEHLPQPTRYDVPACHARRIGRVVGCCAAGQCDQ